MLEPTRGRARSTEIWIALLGCLWVASAPDARAQLRGDGSGSTQSPRLPLPVTKPGYLIPTREATYFGTLARIAGDVGSAYVPCSAPPCRWALQVRQTYSKIQPWNSNGTLLAIDNNDAKGMKFGPSHLLLDGAHYTVLDFPKYPYPGFGEYRWHPSQPYVQIAVDNKGSELKWVDVRTGKTDRNHSWKFEPGAVQGIGMGEGNPSDDARYIALGRTTEVTPGRFLTHVFAVDMLGNRMGDTSWTVPDCDLAPNDNCDVGWFTISPDGHFLVVKYADQGDSAADNRDCTRVFDFNRTTLAFTPHAMTEAVPCGRRMDGTPLDERAGWVHPLKHADLTGRSAAQAALIGINSCLNTANRVGRILRVDLSTGRQVTLSPPDVGSNPPRWFTEAPAMHVSCRNVDRPGWCFVSYDAAPGKRFDDEIVALSTDGRGAVERFARQHSFDGDPMLTETQQFRAEPHAVPSRDGRRVVWSSNWCWPVSDPPCPSPADVKTYVVEGAAAEPSSPDRRAGPGLQATADPGADPGPARGLEMLPNPFARSTTLRFELPAAGLVRLEVFDAQGRRVATLADRYFLAGAHAILWDHGTAEGSPVPPGVYLCRLTAGSFRDQKQVVLLP